MAQCKQCGRNFDPDCATTAQRDSVGTVHCSEECRQLWDVDNSGAFFCTRCQNFFYPHTGAVFAARENNLLAFCSEDCANSFDPNKRQDEIDGKLQTIVDSLHDALTAIAAIRVMRADPNEKQRRRIDELLRIGL